ncbi:MAG: arylsulfotransferase family protein [Acidobacteriota bacterium]
MRRWRILALLLVALAVALVALWIGRPRPSLVTAGLEVPPPGRWRTLPVERRSGSGGGSAEERARMLSLPYAAGTQRARDGAQTGVVALDVAKAAPGINLEVSGHGPEAVLRSLDGALLGRWKMPFERAFPEQSPNVETAFFRRAALLPEGRLIALYQTGGLVELDRSSAILRRCPGSFYNDFFVAADGTLWTLAKEARPGSEGREVLEDFAVALAPGDCREVQRLSLPAALAASPFAAVLEPRGEAGDVYHSNTIEVFDGRLASASPLFAAGHLLVSLREIDTLAILDPSDGEVLWAQRGPWRRQHQPTPQADGTLLVFDNRGFQGASRLLTVDPASGDLPWQWGGDPPRAFFSREAGSVQRLTNGNLLVTESERGRAFELDENGQVVWEFQTPHRAGRDGSLVATLMEVVRYPAALWEAK